MYPFSRAALFANGAPGGLREVPASRRTIREVSPAPRADARAAAGCRTRPSGADRISRRLYGRSPAADRDHPPGPVLASGRASPLAMASQVRDLPAYRLQPGRAGTGGSPQPTPEDPDCPSGAGPVRDLQRSEP